MAAVLGALGKGMAGAGKAAAGAAAAAGSVGAGMAGVSASTSMFQAMGKPAVGKNAAHINKYLIDPLKKTAKNKSGNKEFGKAMKAISGAVESMGMSMILYYIESMGVLNIYFKVWGAYLRYLGGIITILWMPLIERWIAVMTSPEHMAAMEALGTWMATFWLPAIEAMVVLSEAVDWGAVAAFWLMMAGASKDYWDAQYRAAAAFENSIMWLGALYINTTKWIYSMERADAIIKNVTRTLNSMSSGGRGGGGGGGGRGSYSSMGSSLRSALGLHEGTSYVPSTGWRFLEKGEAVTSSSDNLAQSGQMESLITTQEEMLNEQKRLNKFMRYGV